MQTSTVQTLKKEDVSVALRMLSDCGAEIFNAKDIGFFREQMDSFFLQKHMKKSFAYTLKKDHETMGMIIYRREDDSEHYLEITCLVIDPKYQHQGFGAALVKKTMETMRKYGGDHVFLKTSDAKYNEAARSFYTRLGFQEMGVLPDYYPGNMPSHKKMEGCAIFYKRNG